MVIQQLVNGLALGCAYGLIALGYSFMWNAVGFVNMAQGAFVMVGAFVFGVTFTNRLHLPFALSFALLVVVMSLFGMACERILYRPLKNAHIRTVLVSLVALGMLLGNLVLIVWGPYPQATEGPFGQRLLTVGGVSVTYQNLLIIGVTLILLLVQSFLFKRTTIGKVLRAVAQDKDTASLTGIESDLAVSLNFAYSSVLGGIILGVCEIFGASYISSLYKDAIVYIIIIAFLLFRPECLFGRKREQSGL